MDLIRADNRQAALVHWKTELGGTDLLEHAVAKILDGELDPQDAEDKAGYVKLDPGRLEAIRQLMAKD
jgi:hypothetical protein